MNNPLLKRAVAKSAGTAMLLAAIVGSVIMGERLAAGAFAATALLGRLALSVRKDTDSAIVPHERK